MSNLSWLDAVKWDDKGLVTAIAQDKHSQRIMMVANVNRESLQLTADTGIAHYWSRSRNRLWKKGEESGHLVIQFRQEGQAVETCWIGRSVTCRRGQRKGRLRHEREVPRAGHRTGLCARQVRNDVLAVVFAVKHRIVFGHDDSHRHCDARKALGSEDHRHGRERDHRADAAVGH